MERQREVSEVFQGRWISWGFHAKSRSPAYSERMFRNVSVYVHMHMSCGIWTYIYIHTYTETETEGERERDRERERDIYIYVHISGYSKLDNGIDVKTTVQQPSSDHQILAIAFLLLASGSPSPS